jgi:hypothetical protein
MQVNKLAYKRTQSYVTISFLHLPLPIGRNSLRKYKTYLEIRIRGLRNVTPLSKCSDNSSESSTQDFVLISKLAEELRRLQCSLIISLLRRMKKSYLGE